MLRHDVGITDASSVSAVWISLPIAVHLVNIHVQETQTHPAVLKRLRSLMQVLYLFKARFQGVKYVIKLLDAVINAIAGALMPREDNQESPCCAGGCSVTESESERVEKEARLLATVTKLIDRGLAVAPLHSHII